jgi:DNA-directed RNA polymerase subunit RPC12/RpoP
MTISECSNCGGRQLFRARKPVSAGGGYAPNHLPGLGGAFAAAKLDVIVCQLCGLTRFFARREALERLPTSSRWERV